MRGGASLMVTPKAGATGVGVALHSLQWSQACTGTDAGPAGACSDGAAASLWQMTEKGSAAGPADSGAIPHRIACKAIATIANAPKARLPPVCI